MPPQCDSMDGLVVTAAKKALALADVNVVLPFVHKEGEQEVMGTFDRVSKARKEGPTAREVADLHFFETGVRIHRAGEGAAYTGAQTGRAVGRIGDPGRRGGDRRRLG